MASPTTGAPPQPAQVGQPGPPPQSPMQGLVGDQANGADQSLQLISQKLMQIEETLGQIVEIDPRFAGIRDKFVNEVKPQAGQILFGQGQQQQAQPNPMGMLVGAGAGMAGQ